MSDTLKTMAAEEAETTTDSQVITFTKAPRTKPQIVRHREQRIDLSEHLVETTVESTRSGKLNAKLLNVSRFGCAIEVDQENCFFEINEEISLIKIQLHGQKIYEGKSIVVNETSQEGTVRLGLLFKDDLADLDQVHTVLQHSRTENSLGSVRNIIDVSKQILPQFKELVADLNTIFQDLKSKLDKEEARIAGVATSPNHKTNLEEQIVNLAISLYQHDINMIFDKFGKIVEGMDFDRNALHKQYFRTNFHPDVMGTPFLNRSFSKPLGHAGDYGLMVMLYEYEDQGRSLFHKFFHRWSCNAPAAIANKNRVEFLAEIIVTEYAKLQKAKEGLKISSVACGPAREVENFLNYLDVGAKHDVKVVCVDQEGQALDHALTRVRMAAKKHSGVETVFLKEDAVLGIIRGKPFVKEIENSNIISCAGLFDYVSDRLSTKMIQCFYELLAPGGVMLIGNVSDQNPDRFSMDYLVDWHLILRSPSDMHRLVPEQVRNAPGVKIDVISEALGLNLFLTIRKPSE